MDEQMWSVDAMAIREADAGAVPVESSEAFRALHGLCHRKTGRVPAGLYVRHVLALTRDADWTVQRAAMEALLRRCSVAKHDRLAVSSRPRRGAVFGTYATRRADSAERPYTTLVTGLDPLRGSCDCRDFARNSLGLCKHLCAVLDDLAADESRFERVLAAQGPPAPAGPRLVWDPIRPLTGHGDWLARVRVVDAGAALAEQFAGAARWFRRDGSGEMTLKSAWATRPECRLELVNDLLRLVTANGHRRSDPPRLTEPALRSLLMVERERLERLTANARVARDLTRALRSLKRQLYPYQRTGVERLLANGRLLLADDMGLGKTAQAIAACHALWTARRAQRGLVIVPASLKPQWLNEWQQFTEAPVAVVDGQAADRRRAYQKQGKGFLIANYEQVLRDLEHMRGWRPDIVVLDEAQRIKNWATKTAAYVKQLQPPFRLVLTGTPMENRLEELASILDWVDDMALEPKWRLSPWHSNFSEGSKQASGARNLDTLRARISHCVVRRVRSEVLRQLPPRTDTMVPVELTEAQREEHEALDQPIARLASIARQRPLTQVEFLRLMSLLTTQRIVANGIAQARFAHVWPVISQVKRPDAALLKSLSTPKLIELREILAQVAGEQGRKVVVFSQWHRMLMLADWAVADLLADAGVRAVFFTGKERQKQRTRNLVEFHDDPSTRVLFATDAGGVGLNLQRAASCCINIELPWNPAVLEQRIGRIYRLGQKRPIDVYNFVTQPSIESRIAGLVADKKAFFSGLFDGSSDGIRFERSASFLSRLETIVEPVAVPELPEAREAVEEGESAEEREMDEMVAAADESQDAPSASAAESPPPVAAVRPAALPSAADVQQLFAQLDIRPNAAGGITIDAPPAAAASLAALFEGMARMLRAPVAG